MMLPVILVPIERRLDVSNHLDGALLSVGDWGVHAVIKKNVFAGATV